jgi:PAS domain S-box-containing protein
MPAKTTSSHRRRKASLRKEEPGGTSLLAAVAEELRARNRQQAAVATLGQHAIRDRDLATLLDEAATVTAATLGTEYCAIGEKLRHSDEFRVRAGFGWQPGVVGAISSGRGTPAEYMLLSGQPVVIADVATESRFPIPPGLRAYGVVSAIYVTIRGREGGWGNLSAYTTRQRAFNADDIDFLQSVANVLGLAIERHELEVVQRREQELLQAVFDNIPVMISWFDSSGKLLRTNREWEKTLGWTLEEAQQVDIVAQAYPDPEQRRQVLDFIGRAERRWADFRTRTRSGETLETSWARFDLSDGYRLGFGLNLTERKRAEEALAASEARFSRLFQASPVALGMSTITDGRITAVNQSWLELFDYELAEVIGRTGAELAIWVDPRAREVVVHRLRTHGDFRNLELQIRRKSGEVRDVIASGVAIQLGGEVGCSFSALTDITDRKLAEAERDRLVDEARAANLRLGTLSRRVLTAQEAERRRLAVELHDELGQVLTAVKINLESLARSAELSPAPARLEEAIGSVELALRRVRDLALDLRPSVLDDLGLPAALRWYVDRFARDTAVEVRVSIDAVPDLEPEIATACFRIAQEALTNVARHARARQVWLDLHLLGDGLELRVRDDGVGFDAAAARHRASLGASMGLLGMQERVSLVGGTFEIRRSAEGGTEIRAHFPLGGLE